MNELSARWDCHAHVFVGAPLPGSHYAPPSCTLAMWQVTAAPLGFDRVVLVQPSVYGTNNAVMLDALLASNGAHRGVAVVAPDVKDSELEAMHAAGVRGVRFNLVSPVGNDAADIDAIVARIRDFGWHLQLFLRPADFGWVRTQQASWRLPVVLDHMAGVRADVPLSSGDEADLRGIADAGAWVKFSGFYRLGMATPFHQADACVQQLQQWFGLRSLWGSDWPHTWYMEEAHKGEVVPGFADLIAPVRRALPDVKQQRAVFSESPAMLYA